MNQASMEGESWLPLARVLSPESSKSHPGLFTKNPETHFRISKMSLREAMVLMNGHEYGRAISILEAEASNESRSPEERAEYCQWVAECHRKLEDYQECGNWYLEAVKRIFMQRKDARLKAKQALPLAQKAVESYRLGGDATDILEAAKLRERLIDLSKA